MLLKSGYEEIDLPRVGDFENGSIHFGKSILFRKRGSREIMNEKIEYADRWEISSKYFYQKGSYSWMKKKVEEYSTILEIGCGTGYSTLALLESGHKVIALDKNRECIEKAKVLIHQKGYSIGVLPDADVLFIKADIAVEEFYEEVLEELNFEAVLCWNVGSYWDKETVHFYLPYMLEYGLNVSQIQQNLESSYAELILWNACKIAAMKKVPVHIVDRAGEIVNEKNDEYYCTLKKEFKFSSLEFDNLQTDSISGGGLMLVTDGEINREEVIETILVSIIMK